MLKMFGEINLILMMATKTSQEESMKNNLLTLPVNVYYFQRKGNIFI